MTDTAANIIAFAGPCIGLMLLTVHLLRRRTLRLRAELEDVIQKWREDRHRQREALQAKQSIGELLHWEKYLASQRQVIIHGPSSREDAEKLRKAQPGMMIPVRDINAIQTLELPVNMRGIVDRYGKKMGVLDMAGKVFKCQHVARKGGMFCAKCGELLRSPENKQEEAWAEKAWFRRNA